MHFGASGACVQTLTRASLAKKVHSSGDDTMIIFQKYANRYTDTPKVYLCTRLLFLSCHFQCVFSLGVRAFRDIATPSVFNQRVFVVGVTKRLFGG